MLPLIDVRFALLLFVVLPICTVTSKDVEPKIQTTAKLEPEVNDSVDVTINTSAGSVRYNKIEGRVIVPAELPLTRNWHADTRILVNHGEFLGFLK
jgi:biopolymer transport protein ExbD